MSGTKKYLKVTAGLMALLAVTVAAAYIHFGAFNIVVAMLISVAKALLILLFFMHVGRSTPLVRACVCAGFFWLVLMMALTLSDYLTRS